MSHVAELQTPCFKNQERKPSAHFADWWKVEQSGGRRAFCCHELNCGSHGVGGKVWGLRWIRRGGEKVSVPHPPPLKACGGGFKAAPKKNPHFSSSKFQTLANSSVWNPLKNRPAAEEVRSVEKCEDFSKWPHKSREMHNSCYPELWIWFFFLKRPQLSQLDVWKAGNFPAGIFRVFRVVKYFAADRTRRTENLQVDPLKHTQIKAAVLSQHSCRMIQSLCCVSRGVYSCSNNSVWMLFCFLMFYNESPNRGQIQNTRTLWTSAKHSCSPCLTL